MEWYCLPLVTYSCEAVDCDKKQLHKLNVCWNNVYRKVFRTMGVSKGIAVFV